MRDDGESPWLLKAWVWPLPFFAIAGIPHGSAYLAVVLDLAIIFGIWILLIAIAEMLGEV